MYKHIQIGQEIRSIDLSEDKQNVKIYINDFINQMNNKCKRMKINKSRFSNPHGLDMVNNYSCCQDVVKITEQCLKNQEFRDIVKKQTYTGTLKFIRQGKVISKQVHWKNTNKLLSKSNIFGIKTGTTSKAGGCLSTLLVDKNGNQAIVVVLGSRSVEDRFTDTMKIIKLVQQQTSD